MSESLPGGNRLIFLEFLQHIRQQGFSVGITHYLRLQVLLNKIGGTCDPSELKTFLCPLFATSQLQQEQFYRAFDEYFDLFTLRDEALAAREEAFPDPPEENPSAASIKTHGGWLKILPVKRWGLRLDVTDLLVLAVIVGLIVLCVSINLRTRSELNSAVALNQMAADKVSSLRLRVARLEQEVAALQTDAQAIESFARKRFGLVRPSDIVYKNLPDPEEYILSAEASGVDQEIPDSLASEPTALEAPDQSLYRRHLDLINIIAIFIPLVIFLISELYRISKRNLIVEKQQGKRPPYAWPIQVEPSRLNLWNSPRLHRAAQLMRRRQASEFQELDLEATILATAETLGYPNLRYKQASKQPEYIVLIDRAAFRDHQARLFDDLAKALEEEEVFVTRYFYEGDPRHCCDGAGNYTYLIELAKKFTGHRLIIYGDGERMVDPISGKMRAWTTIFSDWKDCALLTPVPTLQWGINEISLAKQFILLPATLNGLLALVDHFDSTVLPAPHSWGQPAAELLPRSQPHPRIIQELLAHLGEETFQWLCACAIYPEIQWDLTLYLGRLPCMKEGLLQEANILRLVRLPWFRNGSMPDELRLLLIQELNREKEKAIRSAIAELLEQNSPPRESFAADEYRLNLAVQRWFIRRDRKRRREMRQAISAMPQGQIDRDHALLRALETKDSSPLAFFLPRRLRKIFYRKGVPIFGLRSVIRALITLVIMVSIASLVPSPPRPGPALRKPSPTVLARDESKPIEWLDDQAVPMNIGMSIGSGINIPPITLGFSRSDNPQADALVNAERIAAYKKLERELNRGPNSIWDNIDQVDLANTNAIILHLIKPPVTIQVGNKGSYANLARALQILDAIRRRDTSFLARFFAQNPKQLIKNSSRIDFMNIDISRPERIVLHFRSPTTN